jgi:hypothetical protein
MSKASYEFYVSTKHINDFIRQVNSVMRLSLYCILSYMCILFDRKKWNGLIISLIVSLIINDVKMESWNTVQLLVQSLMIQRWNLQPVKWVRRLNMSRPTLYHSGYDISVHHACFQLHSCRYDSQQCKFLHCVCYIF